MPYLLRREEALDTTQLDDLAEQPQRAARLVLVAAAAGEVEAQALLGQILLEGHGIQADPTLALTWFDIAAERGHAMACNMAGRCHEHGWGCAADPARAAEYYRRAADLGLDWGMYNLANLLATGRGVVQDHTTAYRLYRQAAELGHAKSMNLTGRCLEDGCGVARDLAAAHAWYARSAEAGDFRGQFSHAAVLLAERQWDAARHWLSRALELGHLKFIETALASLQAAALPPIADIVEAYAQRRDELRAGPR
ncbi:tetratricopeptide repeat protein [Stutzerimonas frequens]|uniref:tetratricopeptide repeat protein n=1 Tax=Stutzerimonas frequens TaxID=2968969 RepID=UPI00190C93C3|nr:tetratricopeptide repeat protein [Stutzerimonas frequens]MBK3757839.1 sel1 repeat family protein [Stutzerimonas frequens]MBK3872969.1 sel1 repeat family protein [Stutzerimonas frequens]MBK3911238.1 sel1 repeat family protein [Stutzerimonas frequens]MBK3930521.1 sel1 repeat family protein [Stutzerimonas frequens]